MSMQECFSAFTWFVSVSALIVWAQQWVNIRLWRSQPLQTRASREFANTFAAVLGDIKDALDSGAAPEHLAHIVGDLAATTSPMAAALDRLYESLTTLSDCNPQQREMLRDILDEAQRTTPWIDADSTAYAEWLGKICAQLQYSGIELGTRR